MQQSEVKCLAILLHSFAVANKSLTSLLPVHSLQAIHFCRFLDLLLVQIVIDGLHLCGRLAVLLPVFPFTRVI